MMAYLRQLRRTQRTAMRAHRRALRAGLTFTADARWAVVKEVTAEIARVEALLAAEAVPG